MRKRIFTAGFFVLIVLVMFVFGLGVKQAINSNTTEKDVIEKQVQENNAQTAPVEEPIYAQKEEKTEPQYEKEEIKTYTCSLIVRCDALLEKIDKLSENKQDYVPPNGIIYSGSKIEINGEETVFDVLKRETEANNIHLDAEQSIVYNSVYVKGIGNLYEFDCGDSGWIYTVNGESPMHGCSQHKVNNNDKIEFVYICR